MKVMVTGGRDYADREFIKQTLEAFQRRIGRIDELLVGCATGADSLAQDVAKELGIKVKVFKANWSLYGKAAGPKRNERIIEERPSYCLPFPGGKGTAHAVGLCKLNRIPLFYLSR